MNIINNSKIAALNLNVTYPRSPREALGGYIVAGRMLDKCRAVLAGTNGEYHFGCPLDQTFFDFTRIDPDYFKDFVATGANDDMVSAWIQKNSRDQSKEEIVAWNNDLRYKRISEMPIKLQIFLEGYIQEFIPPERIVYHWFDVYDIEEGRI